MSARITFSDAVRVSNDFLYYKKPLERCFLRLRSCPLFNACLHQFTDELTNHKISSAIDPSLVGTNARAVSAGDPTLR